MNANKLYLWDNANDLTDNWHSGGAMLIAAPDIETARDMAKYHIGEQSQNHDPEYSWKNQTPMIIGVTMRDPEVWIFQDAGCC